MKICKGWLQALLSPAPRSRVLARLASLAQIGEFAHRLLQKELYNCWNSATPFSKLLLSTCIRNRLKPESALNIKLILNLVTLLTNYAKNCPLQNDIHKALLNHNQLLCLCFYLKIKDNQVSNKNPFPLTLMLNFMIPVLSGQPVISSHLAIPRGWPLNEGLIVHQTTGTTPIYTNYTNYCKVLEF